MNQRITAVVIITCVISSALCEWRQYGGGVYYFSHLAQPPDLRNYTDAVDACSEQHGGAQLVSINSEEEHRFLTINSEGGSSWIGLMCEARSCVVADRWWADGSRVTYTGGISSVGSTAAVIVFFIDPASDRFLATGASYPKYYICERDDTCLSSPCLNGGSCLVNSTTGNWSCDCPEGTLDDNCTCDASFCENDRPCVNNGENETLCDCGEAFNGSRCELDIDECLDASFCNDGECTNSYGGFNCSCPTTRQGDRCEDDVNECEIRPRICQNGATCHNEPQFSYSCDCQDGYIGHNCQIDIDECASNLCDNGACVDAVNAYNCNCYNGYTGEHCDLDIDECLDANFCNGGQCSNSHGGFSCDCPSTREGDRCEDDVNECQLAPGICQNGATCHNEPEYSYSCDCDDGYIGQNCQIDIDECASNPCVNGACADAVNAYNCLCHTGYTGEHCDLDIDECASNLCVNGACVDEVNAYNCNCYNGYTGEHCDLDIDECDDASEYCSPQSGCLNSPGSYSCVCPIGFEGADCSDDVNECEEHGCHSNGECTNYHGSYTCVCVPGYDVINDCAPLSSNHNDDNKEVALSNEASIAMLALGCLLAVASVVAVSIAIFYARKWKKRMLEIRQRYVSPETEPVDTELHEITDTPKTSTNRGASQTYDDVTASTVSVVAGKDASHVYESTEPTKIYENTHQEPDTYDTLTF